MYDENQLVKIRWNNTNRELYESKGYVYTKRYDTFEVMAKDLSTKSKAKIKVLCDYCGREYETPFSQIIIGRKSIPKDCCSHCTGKKSSEISFLKRSANKFQLARQICNDKGYVLITKENEYINSKMNIIFDCPKHGLQTMILDNLVNGHECIECSYEKRFNEKRHSPHYIKSIIDNCGNTLLNPEDYQNAHETNLKIQCKCGNTFTTSWSNYIKAGVRQCSKCSNKESKAEKFIREFLEKHNINFVQEMRFTNCRDIKPLPFDFYLPDKNTIIEFDGIHHYKKLDKWGNFEDTVKHDNIKNSFCKQNGISLIRIPYFEYKNLENILTAAIL